MEIVPQKIRMGDSKLKTMDWAPSVETHLRFLTPNLGELILGDGDKIWAFLSPDSASDMTWDASIYSYLKDHNSLLILPRKTPPTLLTRLFDRHVIFTPPNLGSPVDFDGHEDRRDTARFLSALHRDCSGMIPVDRSLEIHSLIDRWERRRRRLREFMRIARNRRTLGPIDRYLVSIKEELTEQVDTGLKLLQESPYIELLQCRGCICFYHYRQELFLRVGADIKAWSFAGCVWDIPIVDLYRYLLHLSSHGGYNEMFIERTIEAYEKNRPLTAEERMVLKALFYLPEHLYRIISSYYLARKDFSERRLYQRLTGEWERSDERIMRSFAK